jgi:hypothetical protein
LRTAAWRLIDAFEATDRVVGQNVVTGVELEKTPRPGQYLRMRDDLVRRR